MPDQRGPSSTALLSHTRIVRCAGCGGSMSAATLRVRSARPGAEVRTQPVYRCQRNVNPECQSRAGINQNLLDAAVVEYVTQALADESATASASVELDVARGELAEREAALSHAVEVL